MKSRLFSIGPKARPKRPSFRAIPDQSDLEALRDKDGSVAFGWVAPAVLYNRFDGGFTSNMGCEFATRLGALVAQSQSICLFCDCSELKYYELLARSAFARVILSHRRRFTSIVILTWAEGISQSVQTLATTLGEPIEILTDADVFEARLLRKAPLAMRKLDPKIWVSAVWPAAQSR
jgi:hypothetical protein